VKEASTGRQVIIFTHNLIFYQEILDGAATANPQVPVLKSLIARGPGNKFGVVSENDAPWIAKRVTERITYLERRLTQIPERTSAEDDEWRRICVDFYTDLRETWERLVEEVVFGGVVERYNPGVKTQSLAGVYLDDQDYLTIYANMAHVSELSGHDMAAARQIALPDKPGLKKDLAALNDYRSFLVNRRKETDARRRQKLQAPAPTVA
jgi:hypothetical protein